MSLEPRGGISKYLATQICTLVHPRSHKGQHVPQACTKGSKSICVSREMLIYASGRASPLGELHKCFSHTFQFFRKFLLQRLCKMRVCACVELLSGLWSKAVFLCCLWVGIVLPWLLMGCIPVIQPQGLAPPHFWVHALSSPPLSMFTFPATSAFAWPSPSPSNHTLYNLMPPHIFSVFSCPVHLLHLVSCTTYLSHLCPGKVLGHRNQRSATLLPLH